MTDEAAKADRKTSYVILSKTVGADWTKLFSLDAASADAAIKAAASSTDAPDGLTLVAIPERSWKPRTVTVETAPRVKLS